MTTTAKYKIVKGINDLPPRNVEVITIGASGLDLDIVSKFNAMALDVQVSNKDASTATVSINGKIGYTLGSGDDQTHNNIQCSAISVTGITAGFVILQTIPISELKKVGALEEA